MATKIEKPVAGLPIPNYEALASNTARLMEELGHATAASLKPIEEGRSKAGISDEVSDVMKTLGQVVENIASDPQRLVMAQTALTKGFLDLWANNLRRTQGETVTPIVEPDATDKRFRDPEWTENPVFDFGLSDHDTLGG